MKKTKIIALFGKSACGKDTIKNQILYNIPNTNRIVSMTTRPPRLGEQNGVSYDFVDEEEFSSIVLAGDMLEATNFRGWLYGTPIRSLDENKINVGIFNPEGISAILDDDRLDVLPIYVYAPDKQRLIRSLTREDEPDCAEICRRFGTDEKDFGKLEFMNGYNYLTFSNFNDIIYKERMREFLRGDLIQNFIAGQEWKKLTT